MEDADYAYLTTFPDRAVIDVLPSITRIEYEWCILGCGLVDRFPIALIRFSIRMKLFPLHVNRFLIAPIRFRIRMNQFSIHTNRLSIHTTRKRFTRRGGVDPAGLLGWSR